MWISYLDSEVRVYHPLCEECLNRALQDLKLKEKYIVKHHQRVGTLEMDYVICNKITGKYLCVIEVKRTPADIQSARYQYQAMSYVQMAFPELERPFYVITNLEYSYTFRYDSLMPRVFQQMLEPGLICTGEFKNYNQDQFCNKLTETFKEMIEKFINDEYEYSITLDKFVEYMSSMKSNKKNWRSSLVILLYEYIRGAFISVGRNALKDVRAFKNDIELICDEAIKINFKEIFNYNIDEYLPIFKVDNQLLSNLFDFGKTNISADTISNILHSIASEGKEHSGKVSTDNELARFVSVLGKYAYGESKLRGIVCDPAAGSGSLISSAIDVLGLTTNQIMVNDIEPYFIELLSLRLGLKFPRVIDQNKSPTIYNEDIANLDESKFKNVDIVVLNPPYIAGIYCTDEKYKLSKRIQKITGNVSKLNIGQVGMEAVFIELVNSLIEKGTIISCIMPKQYLVARGIEAINFRKFLLEEFGLEVIYNYPGENLFNGVTKDTCILVGRKGSEANSINVFTSIENVQNIDIDRFYKSIKETELTKKSFIPIMPGVEGICLEKKYLINNLNDGWRNLNSELSEAIQFVKNELINNRKLELFKELDFEVHRGKVGNNGASNLLFFNTNAKFFERNKILVKKLYPAMKNAFIDEFVIDNGDTFFFNYNEVKSKDYFEKILDDYISIEKVQGKQIKKEKNADQLKKILFKEAKNITSSNSVLIPRNLRTNGKVYIVNKDTYVSTNFIVIKTKNKKNAEIIGSWISTIFYQLICEISAKDQEGTRKMEMADIYNTYIPNPNSIDDCIYDELMLLIPSIKSLNLQNPEIRKIDMFWAKVIFGKDAKSKVLQANRLLKFLARKRNSKK